MHLHCLIKKNHIINFFYIKRIDQSECKWPCLQHRSAPIQGKRKCSQLIKYNVNIYIDTIELIMVKELTYMRNILDVVFQLLIYYRSYILLQYIDFYHVKVKRKKNEKYFPLTIYTLFYNNLIPYVVMLLIIIFYTLKSINNFILIGQSFYLFWLRN